MAHRVEMKPEDRDRHWERDADRLRQVSSVLGVVIALLGIVANIVGVVAFIDRKMPAQGALLFVGGAVTVLFGLFIRYLGHAIAAVVEITWYGLIDKRRGAGDRD